MSKGIINMPPAMILCGGQGTRLRDVTELLPKPMVPIGSQPIIWHIMKIYSMFGVKRFILCLGYKREIFIDYFLNYHARATDITIKLGKERDVTYHGENGEEDWEVVLANTGDDSMTACRVFRAAKYLKESDKDFFLTYGDALSDININALYKTHLKNNKQLTVTAVHPAERFGKMLFTNGKVTSFQEKTQTESDFINGGFMVLKKDFVRNYLKNDISMVLEQEPIHKSLEDEQMGAFEHNGFWQCMDTGREHALLNKMWASKNPPWTKYWEKDDR